MRKWLEKSMQLLFPRFYLLSRKHRESIDFKVCVCYNIYFFTNGILDSGNLYFAVIEAARDQEDLFCFQGWI